MPSSQKSPIDASQFVAETFAPAYLPLYRSGELARRVEQAVAELAFCQVCPRNCGVDRLADETAVCQIGRHALVSSYFPHFGEEDCLRGWQGSGTIFFAMCNLRCVFCQNADISQARAGLPVTAAQLAQMMLDLQARGCHNINFVTPEHVVPQMLEALLLAVAQGLRLPLVYNTSAYDSPHSLALLAGIIDIYMPDFKIWDPALSSRLLKARDYPQVARAALREMQRQVGVLKTDGQGLAKRGLLVRHLVMPEGLAGTADIMRFLVSELSPDTYVNLMDQYYPAGAVSEHHFPELNRHLTRREFQQAQTATEEAGIWRLDRRQHHRQL